MLPSTKCASLAALMFLATVPGAWGLDWRSSASAQAETGFLAAQQPIAQPSLESIQQTLETAKQHYRKAEFKQAIALYQGVLVRSGIDSATQAEVLTRLGEIDLWINQGQQAEGKLQQALQLTREIKDRRREGEVLALLGWAARNRQDYAKSLELARQALTIAQQIGDRKGESLAQIIMGSVFCVQTQFPKALDTLQDVLKDAEAVDDKEYMPFTYYWLALTYYGLKDFNQANAMIQRQQALSQEIGYRAAEYSGLQIVAAFQQPKTEQVLQVYQKQLAIAQAAENPWFERSVLLEMGGLYANQKQLSQALEAYEKALAIARTIDDESVGEVENRIGNTFYRMEQYPKALEAYQRSLTAYQKTTNQSALARVWMNFGETYRQLKQDPKSLEAFQQALVIYQKVNNESAIGDVKERIGDAFYRMKQYDQSIEFYQQALTIYEKLNQPPQIAQVWSDLGWAYYRNKQYPQALAAYQKELEIARTIQNRALELSALKGQGFVYSGQGESLSEATEYQAAIAAYEKSLVIWQQVQTLARELKDDSSEQDAIFFIQNYYFDLGYIFDHQNQYAEAVTSYQQGLKFWRQHRDRLLKDRFIETEQQLLSQLGIAYSNNGQYSQALAIYQELLRIAEQQNNFQKQQKTLRFISSIYSQLGEHKKSLETSQQTLAIVREKLKKDPYNEMHALIRVAQSLGDLGQLEAALKFYQEALVIARSQKNISSEVALLNNISNNYSNRGDYLQALNLQQKALNQLQTAIQQLQSGNTKAEDQLCGIKEINDPQLCLKIFQLSLSSLLNNLAFVYDGLGRYPEALKTHEQGLAIAQQYKDLDRQTTFLNNIGNVYLAIGDYPKALDVLQQAMKIALASGARSMQGRILNNIGRVYDEQGQTTKALSYLQQSLEVAQAIQSPAAEATALNNLAGIYSTQGDFERALEFHQRSISIKRQYGFEIVTALNNIAVLYIDQGKYDLAVEQLQQSLEMARKTGDLPNEVIILRNIGEVYHAQSSYAKALEFYQQAQALSQKMGSRSSEFVGLLAQGRVYVNLGQYSQGLERLQRSLLLSRELGEKNSEASTLIHIANVYRKQKNYPQALQVYQQSLTLFRETGNLSMQSVIFQRIAETYEKQGNWAQAERFLQDALALQRKIGLRPREASTLNTLGQVYLAQGQVQAAQEALQQALNIAQTVNDRTTQAEALATLGKLFQTQPELAIAFYKQSVNTYEGIRTSNRSLSKEQQESYTQTIADTYRQLADLLLSQGRIGEAQKVLELLKIQEINAVTEGTRSATPLTQVPLTQIEQEIIKKYNSLIAFGQQRDTCKQTNCPKLEEYNQTYRNLTAAYDQFIEGVKTQLIKERDTAIAASTDDFSGGARKIVDTQPNTVLIYPLVLKDKTRILWASKGGVLSQTECPLGEAQLSKLVEQFRTDLQNSTDLTPVQTTGQQLYQCLLPQKLRNELTQNKITNLIFVPDRVTNYIPMAALYDGKQYLIEQYSVSNILSVSLTDTQATLPDRPSVLGFGLSQPVTLTNPTREFSSLPYVTYELDNIVKSDAKTDSRGVLNGITWLDRDFSRKTLEAQLAQYKPNILHIATHGEFVPTAPRTSYLVLGDSTPYEISQIQYLEDLQNVHLVVLSACETALGGSDRNGSEVAGIAAYFLSSNAKAKAVLASLWKVNDPATSLLMSEFYQNLTPGKSKTQALRQVQLKFINSQLTLQDAADRAGARRYIPNQKRPNHLSHPYYWAPFILMGNNL
ncbi:tetratricopeptide repeat protein [Alkalinema sp. FACHB-956]|uniref:tetratricopeptide repeat protein n=1 Tax=Alkalinema sp. FACHB-956 TaxID=2692768 RepID=UPI0016875449|nr:tetratricopeptide repeat protein [Alkalinema sp. FACHB-956]MBD2328702.1 tetratricopeptide repeat protein [Alkalinema sp. FACHB-956]